MARSANTVWEVQTGGNDTNGGGFVAGASGTDWTQQAAAQYSVTDAVTNGTTTITSATANFGTDVVGNILYIQGGTGSITADWYEITSRTNSTTIVVDRSTGLTTGTGATLKIGGALLTLAKAEAVNEAGQTVYVKAGSGYTLTSALTLGASGAIGSIIKWIGYTTTRTDNGRATVTTATDSIKLVNLNGKNHRGFKNFNFTTTASTRSYGIWADASSSVGVVIVNCIVDGFTRGIHGGNIADDFGIELRLIGCEVKNCTTSGVRCNGQCAFVGNYIHDNTGGTTDGLLWNPAGVNFEVFAYNTFARNGRYGFTMHDGNYGDLTILSNNFDANGGSGIYFPTSAGNRNAFLMLQNNIFWDNGGYGIELQAATYWYEVINRNNAYGSNNGGGSGLDRLNVAAGTGDVAITADPWIAASSGNYALNEAAGGGVLLKAVGWPGVALFGTGYEDIGAVQHQNPARARSLIGI